MADSPVSFQAIVGRTTTPILTPSPAGEGPDPTALRVVLGSFAAVSLAIVWGAMAERTRLYVYIVFGIAFTLL